MSDRENVINDLQDAVNDDWMWQHADYYALTMERAIALLKEQEESIPVSWLKEKLVGHPEIPYAVTDGIIAILDMWEGR